MIPISRLHELFMVDHHAGVLYRRGGKRAGSLNDSKGYLRVTVDGERHMVHRVIYAMTRGEWPSQQVDHINTDKTDNRPCNLREASRHQNCQNIGIPAHNTSGIKGVYFNERRGKWVAQINVAGKRTHLGHFGDKSEAANAYRTASLEHYGEFARPA